MSNIVQALAELIRVRANSKKGLVAASDFSPAAFYVELLEARVLLAGITLGQQNLGNVFTTGQAVQIPLQATGDTIQWSVTNFYGTQVDAGSTPISGGSAIVAPGTTAKGYFEIHLTALSGSTVQGQADTTFAILAPVNAASMQDSKFGVMTHFAHGWNPDITPLLSKAGIVHARDEQYWDTVETTQGAYTYPGYYTTYMSQLAANNVDPVMVASYENPFYDADNTPYTAAGRTGYANYAKALLNKYGSQIKTLEIWNEYNGSFVHGPVTADRPLYYTQMLQSAYTAVKAVRPDVTVLGGAAVLTPLGYFHQMFIDGALNYMDGIVIHPYVSTPEGVEKEIQALRALMIADTGFAKPIYVTEGGSNPDSDTGGKEEMARYLVRFQTIMMSENVPLSSWYLARDYENFDTGLLSAENDPRGKYVPSAAYVSYSNLIRQLYHYTFVQREATDARTRIYQFSNAGDQLRVAWNTDGASQVVFNTTTPLIVVDIMGNSQTYSPTNGKVQLTVDRTPVYIKGAVSSVTDNLRPDELVADSAADYIYAPSHPQNTNGWYYGFMDGDGTGSGNGTGPTGAYTDDDFEPMTWVLQDYGYKWTSPYGYQEITERNVHPSTNGSNQSWSVRRWVSDVAGTVRLTGTVTRPATQGDGTGVRILLNGTQVYAGSVTPSSQTLNYDVSVTVAVGSIIDFALTPGSGGDISYDATSYTASVTRTATAPTLPSAPSGLTATATSSSQINLAWTDNSNNETGFKVERATDSGFTQNVTLVTTTAAGATSYSNSSLSASTAYYYRVRATNSAGDSANTSVASATTQASSGSAVKLTGTIIGTIGSYSGTSSDDRTKVFDGNTNTYFDSATANGVWAGLDLGTAQVITEVKYAPRYYFADRTVGGKFQGSNTADFSSGVVDLFTISAQAPYYTLTSGAVTNSTAFRYVRYLSPNAGYGNMAEVEFWGGNAGPTVPAAASGLTATATSSSNINLVWTDNSNNETGFKVERATDSGFTQSVTLVTTTAAGVTSYGNMGLSASTTYYYRVRATNSAGDSSNSNSASATTQASSGTPTKFTGTIIGTTGSYSGTSSDDRTKVFDGNTNTYFDSATANGVWAGLDLGTAQVITEVKYAPRYYFADRTVGGKFQGSNTVDFSSGVVDLFTISAQAPYYTLTSTTVTNPTAFRYVRYLSPNNGYGNMAEVEFWGGSSAPTVPVAPSGLAATTTSSSQINLTWSDNSSDETGFEVERATDSGFTQNVTLVMTTAANAISYSNTSLSASTTYYYRVRATNTAGDSANSNSANATTQAPPVTTPAAPSGLTANATSSSQINLVWTDNSNNETGFKVERATDSGFTQNVTVVTTTAAGATSYNNTGLTASTTYYYRVRATNSAGDSANSNSASATPQANSGSPTKLTGTIIGTLGSYQNSSSTRDKVFDGLLSTYFDGPDPHNDWAGLDLGSAQAVSQIRFAPRSGYPDRMVGGKFQASNTADFSSGVVDLYTVAANPAINVLTTIDISATTMRYFRYLSPNSGFCNIAELEFWGGNSTPAAPATPSGLSATATSSTQINLTWTDNSGDETGFKVERATDSGFTQNVTVVTAAANATSYSSTGLSASTTYYFRVRATNVTSDSANSNSANATTQAPPPTAPAAPSGLTATATSSSQINLAWTDNSNNETGFKVERATDSGFTQNVALVTTTAAGATSYNNTGLMASTTYYFRVRATNAAGDSSNSNSANATTQSAAGTKLTGTVIGTTGSYDGTSTRDKVFDGNVNTYFDASAANGAWAGLDLGTAQVITQVKYAPRYYFTDRVVGGKFQGSNTSDFSSGVVDLYTIPNASAQPYVLTPVTITNSTAFRYVRYLSPNAGYCNIAEVEFWTGGGSSPTLPAAPSGLTATATSSSQINLTWVDNSSDEGAFKIERATDSSFTTNLVTLTASPNAVSYANTGLSASTTYYYRVRATNEAGDSANSNSANATTSTPASTAPAAPSSLSATAALSTQINLTWTDNSNNETGFKIERASDSAFTQNVTLLTTVVAGATTYSNTGLNPSTVYYYRVRATNAIGDSANSNVAFTTTPAGTAAVFTQTSPARSYYFNWINNAEEGATETQTMTNLRFFKWLHDNYGMNLDYYLLDAGNVDTNGRYGSTSSAEFQAKFPNGFTPLSNFAATFGTRMGVWIGPDGFGNTQAEEDARYNMILSLVRDQGISLLKLDAACTQLRPEKQEVLGRLLRECRQYCPDLVVLNHRVELGSAAAEANTSLWQGEETYIDVYLSNNQTAPHHRAAALKRGLTPGLDRLLEDHGVAITSALDNWDDDLILEAFGRDLLVSPSIYGNPWLLADAEFAKLARIFNLSERYGNILVNGMTLPEAQYGPAAVSRGDGNTRFITLKNLTWQPVTYTINLNNTIGLTGTGTFEVRQFHPNEKILGRIAAGGTIQVTVEPFRAALVMATNQSVSEVGVNGTAYDVVRDTVGQSKIVKLRGLPGTTASISLADYQRYTSATINGVSQPSLLTGQSVNVSFSGTALTLPYHRKLGDLTSTAVPTDAEALYEATAFAGDSNAMEARSLARSGSSAITEVTDARNAFFNQSKFVGYGIWDRQAFDGNLSTAFRMNRSLGREINGGSFRLDLGQGVQMTQLLMKSVGSSFVANLPAGAAQVSNDLLSWTNVTVTQQGNDAVISLPTFSIRYLRIKAPVQTVAEIEGTLVGGTAANRSLWRASNLFGTYAAAPATSAWSLTTTITEAAVGSYLAVACNGAHGTEGVYAAVRLNGKPIGAPDRAVSYPQGAWQSAVSDTGGNYTYYIPVTADMIGQSLQVVVLGVKSSATVVQPEVYLTTHNTPYETVELVLT